MSADKNHSEQFERYLKGQMTAKEAHAFEREILDDPFAQEALEGYESAGAGSLKDLDSLKKQISQNKRGSFPFLRVAASVALLMLGSFTVYLFTNRIHGEKLAMDEEPTEETVQSSSAPDTTLSLVISKKEEELQLSETQVADEEEITKMEIEVDEQEEAPLPLAEDLIANDADIREESEALAFAFAEEKETVDKTSIAGELQGRVAGIEVASAKIKPVKTLADTANDDQEIAAADFFAPEEENSDDKLDAYSVARAKRVEQGATARSAGISDSPVLIGRVTDESGEALPGATVLNKGTTSGTTTDFDGFFELPKSENQEIVISYVGFESQEITVGSESYIEAELIGTADLQEVVVTAVNAERDEITGYVAAVPLIGNKKFKKYLKENLQYPEAAQVDGIEGTVVLQLSINELGTVTEIDVKKSLGYGCDQEAIRLIRDGPDWEPAEKDGVKVEDKIRVKVKFKLDR